MMFSLLLLGCPQGGSSKQDVLLTDANNYTYEASLDIELTEIEASEDFSFDWSAMSVDMLGHEVSSADIDQVWFIWFRNLEPDALAAGLADNTVDQPDVDTACTLNTDGKVSSANGTDLSFSYNPCSPQQYWAFDEGTYMLRFTTGKDQDADTRMVHFVQPKKDVTNHEVTVSNTSSVLSFSPELEALTQVSAVAGQVPFVDWSGLTVDGLGAPIDWTDVTDLWIARFDGMSVTDLETDFLDLEYLYSELYTTSIYGLQGLELAQAQTADGTPFAGFTTEGTWVFALRCPSCTNPAPPFFSVVSVTAE